MLLSRNQQVITQPVVHRQREITFLSFLKIKISRDCDYYAADKHPGQVDYYIMLYARILRDYKFMYFLQVDKAQISVFHISLEY